MDETGPDGRRSPNPADDVREYVVSEFAPMLVALVEAGSEVADSWECDAVHSAANVRAPLGEAIRTRGLADPLLEALQAGAAVLQTEMQGQPVAAPPYLVVTSRGPICRGTLADGRRLVLSFVLFDVDRRPRCYRFLCPKPEECLDVGLH